jgi:hypothetical protein
VHGQLRRGLVAGAEVKVGKHSPALPQDILIVGFITVSLLLIFNLLFTYMGSKKYKYITLCFKKQNHRAINLS